MGKVMNIGFGNMVNTDKIVSIIASDSAPAKRRISRGKEQETLIDATQGRRTKSVIFTENNKINRKEPVTLQKNESFMILHLIFEKKRCKVLAYLKAM